MTAINNLYIETFRGIKDLKLENLAQINILTGDNNSGKTSILEVLQSLEDLESFNVWKSLLRRETSIFRGLSYYEAFYDLFNINEEKKEIKYQVETEEERLEVEITAKESKEELNELQKEKIFENSYFTNIDEVDPEFTGTDMVSKLDLSLYINKKRKSKLTLYDGQMRIKGQYGTKNKKNIVYISPIKHASGSLFLSNVLDNPKLYQEMLEILKEYDDGIMSINYDSKNENGMNRGVYKILSRSAKKALPLNMHGDGMKKAILLMSAVIKAKNGILLLDEFETAIHTSAMNKTFRWILQTCKKLNVQVFLTSHSEEAIDKVLKCDPEITKDISVYTLSKMDEKTVARKVSGEKAIEMHDHMGLELR